MIQTPQDLSEALSGFPGIRKVTAPAKTVRDYLLTYGRDYMLAGRMWQVQNKRIGPGVYEVWLKEEVGDGR